jgi:hypothetical protein
MIITCKSWTALRAAAQSKVLVEKIVNAPEAQDLISLMRAMCSMPRPVTIEDKAKLIDASFLMGNRKRIVIKSLDTQ